MGNEDNLKKDDASTKTWTLLTLSTPSASVGGNHPKKRWGGNKPTNNNNQGVPFVIETFKGSNP